MILLAANSSSRLLVSGFPNAVSRQQRSTKLYANFFQELQKTFSTATSGGAMRSSSTASKYYTIGITGSGGLVGCALRDELNRRPTVNGKPVRVVRLSRSRAAEEKELEDAPETTLAWNPNGSAPDQIISPSAAAELDAIVHLSGENIATGLGPLGFLGLRPWTAEKKAEILNSRIIPTSALAKVVAATKKPTTFLTASGCGAYGDKFIGDALEAVDETADTSETKGFLADVSRAWEGATAEAAKSKNNRVVNMRFGVVLSKKGGALAKLYPIFFLGGGGIVGSGQQYFTFISARDIARGIVHTLETPSLKGPVNLVAPNPCTNAEFTEALGRAMNRPTLLPFPAFAVSLLFGEMGEETLLGGVRCLPSKLLKSGFVFEHPTVEAAVQSALEESI